MLKVIAYYLHPRSFTEKRAETLRKYFRFQVDLSLRLGWKPSDLQFFSNVDFNHQGVKNQKLNWFQDWQKSLFTKMLALAYVQDQHPNEMILSCDHDSFQLRDLDWTKASAFPITTPRLNKVNFTDSFMILGPGSSRLVKQYVKIIRSDGPFQSRDVRRHEKAYSSELNQPLVFNAENGFDPEKHVSVSLKVCDCVRPYAHHSLDTGATDLFVAQGFMVKDFDAIHFHLNDLNHRRLAATNPLLKGLLEGGY